jgi:hypothetical protein
MWYVLLKKRKMNFLMIWRMKKIPWTPQKLVVGVA